MTEITSNPKDTIDSSFYIKTKNKRDDSIFGPKDGQEIQVVARDDHITSLQGAVTDHNEAELMETPLSTKLVDIS